MFIDRRLGNSPRCYFSKPKDWAMRVPERILKSVGFFARILNKGGFEDLHFAGTGFFVGFPSVAFPNRLYPIMVTASHVADQLSLGDWTLRLNTKDGRSIRIDGTKEDKWWRHPADANVDIAVRPFPIHEQVDFNVIPVSMFAESTLIEEAGIGAGDEIFTVGLFTRFPGSTQNLPLVRTGNIAMIPKAGETIRVKIGRNETGDVVVDAEVYLIESRSIGGLSGSPVFVHLTGNPYMSMRPIGAGRYQAGNFFFPGEIFLLGVATGHWEVFAEERNEINPQGPTGRDRGKDKEIVNLGIAITFPASKLLETLNHPELVAMRAYGDQQTKEAEGTNTLD